MAKSKFSEFADEPVMNDESHFKINVRYARKRIEPVVPIEEKLWAPLEDDGFKKYKSRELDTVGPLKFPYNGK
jgi:hypothetical protein